MEEYCLTSERNACQLDCYTIPLKSMEPQTTVMAHTNTSVTITSTMHS